MLNDFMNEAIDIQNRINVVRVRDEVRVRDRSAANGVGTGHGELVDGFATIVVIKHLGSDIAIEVRKGVPHVGGNDDTRLALWRFR